MTQPNDAPLPYGRQWIDDADLAAVSEQLQSDWLTQGPKVAEFEEGLAAATGATYAVAVSSGTSALHLAALAADIGPGDAGITSPITFTASSNAICYAGGTPAFADVDEATALIDVDRIEERIADLQRRNLKVKALIPVDFGGQPADLPRIHELARRHGALVIEDAAHSLGATYEHDGKTFRAGDCAHADMAILSFHPVKHITTGEGGAITTNDERLYKRLRDLRTHGITKDPQILERNDGPWYYEQYLLGYNYRITDLQCALGVSQLKRLDAFVKRRREIAALYDELLPRLAEHYTPLGKLPGRASSYHLYIVRVNARDGESIDDTNARRRRIFEGLHARNIRVQVHYIPVPWQPFYRRNFGFQFGEFPNAERYYAGCISLPMFPKMSDADVHRVVDALSDLA